METFTLRPVAAGLFFALLALVAGEMHGMAFGAKEDAIIASFKETAMANPTVAGDAAKAEKLAEKGWKYLKRAHEHFMGLGAASLALVLMFGLARVATPLKAAGATAVGLGALLYPLFWTMVATNVPAMGAHEAKESLALMAQAGAALIFLGTLDAVVVAALWCKADKND